MSTSCKGYIGYTVNLKENLSSEDFEFFENVITEHSEYNQFECQGKTLLVVDGFNGEYARLIFVEEKIEDCWIECKDYFKLHCTEISDDIYKELNTAYNVIYRENLDRSKIEYSVWFEYV